MGHKREFTNADHYQLIDWARDMLAASGIRCDYTIPGDLDDDQETALFRVFQLAFLYAQRHFPSWNDEDARVAVGGLYYSLDHGVDQRPTTRESVAGSQAACNVSTMLDAVRRPVFDGRDPFYKELKKRMARK